VARADIREQELSAQPAKAACSSALFDGSGARTRTAGPSGYEPDGLRVLYPTSRLPAAAGSAVWCTCPEGKHLVQFHRTYATPRTGITKDGTRIYRASKRDCDGCALKPRCCPNTPARKIPRDLDKDARDVARALANTPAYERSRHRRKKVEMLFAHLKRILRLGRLRLRGPCGARDEFLLAATAQNLRKLARLRPMAAIA
jgi:hypothetical protein